MLAMRASMTRAVDARGGDVVNFSGGRRGRLPVLSGRGLGGCRPLSWERPGQYADPLSRKLTLVCRRAIYLVKDTRVSYGLTTIGE